MDKTKIRSRLKTIAIYSYHGIAAISLAVVVSSLFTASQSEDRAISAMTKLNPGIKIDHVKLRGSLVEISAKNKTVFATVDGKWFVHGQLFDGATGDLVAGESLQQHEPSQEVSVAPTDWSDLTNYAIRTGKKGMPKLAVLIDPDCSYCRQLDGELLRLGNQVETYTLLYPIDEIHPGATQKAAWIWCAKDQGVALGNVMHDEIEAITPPKSDCQASADTMLAAVSAFADRNGLTGTPALITEDGRIHRGFMTAGQIRQWLQL